MHLRYPLRPRELLGSTNLLERSLEEMQQRVKVIGRFPGETNGLSLCWAVLDPVIADARGLALTELDQLQPARLREERESGPLRNPRRRPRLRHADFVAACRERQLTPPE